MAWLTGWTYRKAIKYGTTKPAGNLTDYPVLLDVAADTDIASRLTANKFTVVASDGETPIPFGVYPSCDGNTGRMLLRFKASPLTAASTGDVMAYLYYDDSQSGVVNEDKTGTVESYSLFMPLEEDPGGSAPQFLDWVSESNVGTSAGGLSSADSVAAEVGYGVDFEDYEYITVSQGSAPDFSSGITMSAIFSADVDSGGGGLNRPLETGGEEFLIDWAGRKVQMRGDGSYPEALFSVVTAGVPTLVSGTWDGSNIRAYTNGSLNNTTASSTFGAAISSGTNWLYIGINGGGFRPYAGIIDELKMSPVARSANWLAYEYENDLNNSNTVTLGTEETQTGNTGAMFLCL